MRRRDREVTDREQMEAYLKETDICRVGFAVDGVPYIVPMNFGYQAGCFYFHCAREGRKIDMMEQNPQVCFELECRREIVTGEQACDWSMRYISIMGTGVLSIVEDHMEKKEGLDILMRHHGYSDSGPIAYGEKMLEHIYVLKLTVNEMTCKKSRYE